MDGINRLTGKGAIARHLRSMLALCTLAVPLAAFSSGCDVGGAANEKVAEADQALKACVTLPATGDAMVTLRPKAQTWGSHPALRVGGNDESLLKFDLSSIPAEASVDSATLKLYASSVNGTNPVQVHAADNPWTESTVTYEGFNQQFETTTSAILDPNVATTYKTADVKGLVNRWRSGAKANNGILLTRDGNDKAQFTSRDGTAGFGPTLTVCYTLIEDLCAADPCQHGACTNGDPTYTCACDPGWTGENCDVNIDECAGNPCLNGSTCTDGVNSYSCACAPGFAGTNCETDIDECAANPCQHGICTDQINAYSCACDPGFAGTNCEIDIDECAGNPCENGSTCTDHVNGYTCACAPGFTGTNCEINIDECAATPCANGDCVDGVNAYTCACLPGWSGANCDVNIDECAGAPCLNGGACTDGIFSYTCDCAAGYTGTNCEVDIDDCAAAPCQNGGLCVDGVNSYTCQCPAGWSGASCDVPAVTCPCQPDFTVVRDSLLSLSHVDHCYYGAYGHSSISVNFGFDADYNLLTKVVETISGTPYGQPNFCGALDTTNGTSVMMDGITDAEVAACEALMPPSCPPVNLCLDLPCPGFHNVCTPSEDYSSYTCACEPGFHGPTCDEPDAVPCPCAADPSWASYLDQINQCAYEPDAGLIGLSAEYNPLIIGGGFYCWTPDYYTEVTPEQSATCLADIQARCPVTNPCDANPCQNGGTCTASEDYSSYTCACPEGVTGNNCEQGPPATCPCEPSLSAIRDTLLSLPALDICEVGATNATLYAFYGNVNILVVASLASGYDPNMCVAVDETQGSYTTAYDISDAEVAACRALLPAACPVPNPCNANPCQNGGTCTASADNASYTCACAAGWTGENCDVADVVTCPCAADPSWASYLSLVVDCAYDPDAGLVGTTSHGDPLIVGGGMMCWTSDYSTGTTPEQAAACQSDIAAHCPPPQ